MILILLATHNGASFLPELLQSISDQTLSQWRMLIRDDGSTDETPALLAEAARRDPRLTVLSDAEGRKGPAMNFGVLMHKAQEMGARYVLPADQDDVWLPDKLDRSMQLMQQAETAAGTETPLLIHADLSVVDERLKLIHRSMTCYAGIRRDPADALRTLLVYNFVTGCTVMLNRPLLNAALPLPQAAVMHDWWLALCAASCGQIWFLPEPVALYRQHANNALGVRSYWQMLMPLSSYWRRRWSRAGTELAQSIQQASALCDRLQARGNSLGISRQIVEDYCRLFANEPTAWRRYWGIRQLGIGPRDAVRQLTLAARVFRLPPIDAGGARPGSDATSGYQAAASGKTS